MTEPRSNPDSPPDTAVADVIGGAPELEAGSSRGATGSAFTEAQLLEYNEWAADKEFE